MNINISAISKKILTLTLILSVMLMCGFGIFMVKRNQTSLRSMLDSKGNALADFIANVSSEYFVVFDFKDFETFSDTLEGDRDVEFAEFYNVDRKVLTIDDHVPPDSSLLLIYEREIRNRQGILLGYLKLGLNKKKLSLNHRDNILIISSSMFIAMVLFLIGLVLTRTNKQLEQEMLHRKKAQKEIKKAYKTTLYILEKAPFGIYIVNSKGDIEYVNYAMLEINGETRQQFSAVNAFEPQSNGSMDLSGNITKVIAGTPFKIGPYEQVSNIGGKATIRNCTGIPFKDDNEKKALIFVEDLTTLEKTRDKLLMARNDWEETFNSITDMVTIHDSEYNIIGANKAALEALEIPDLEMHKAIKCYRHYHGTERPPEGCLSCACLKTEKPVNFEIYEPHLNAYVEIRSIPRFDKNNRLVGLIHVVRDISKRKHDEAVIQSQLDRLNALRSIDKAILASIDLHVVLDIFVDQVIRQLNIDAASILLLNQNTHSLEYFHNKGFRTQALRRTRLRMGESYAGGAAFERCIVNIKNLKESIGGFADSIDFAAEEFVAYFAVPLVARGQVKGVLEIFHRSSLEESREWLEFLEAIADQGAIAIDNSTMFDDLQRSNMELSIAYDNTIEGWSRAMDLRDKETEGHSKRVTEMTVRIAREMGMSDAEIVHMRWGALLHDMGKLGIPDSVLLKPGKLTEEEWIIMKRHPVYAYEMLYPIEHLRPALVIPYSHHEKWDGTGYPKGMKGDRIPLAARIFAVVDVWDALLSDRPYRPGWPRDKVIEHIKSLSGTHFDPEVVAAFLTMDI